MLIPIDSFKKVMVAFIKEQLQPFRRTNDVRKLFQVFFAVFYKESWTSNRCNRLLQFINDSLVYISAGTHCPVSTAAIYTGSQALPVARKGITCLCELYSGYKSLILF